MNIAPDIVSTIVTAVVYRRDGAALNDIVTAFPHPPDRKEVERWVAELVDAHILDEVDTTTPHRYFATRAAAAYLKPKAAGTVAKTEVKAGGPKDGQAEEPPAPSADESSANKTPQPAAEDSFDALFEPQIRTLVVGLMPRSAALIVLQNVATEALPESQRRAFVQWGVDRLSRLTLGDCVRLGCEPEQYEMWRRQYFAVPARPLPAPPPQPPPSASQPTPEPKSVPKGRRSKRAAPEDLTDPPTPVTDPALGSPSASPSRQSVGSASPVAIPPTAIKGIAKLLTEWTSRFLPEGISPTLRPVIMSVIGAAALALVQLVARVPPVVLGSLAVVVGVLVVGSARASASHAASAPPAPTAAPGGSPTAPAASSPASPDGAPIAAPASPPASSGAVPAGSPASSRRRLQVAIGATLLIALVVGFLWYQRTRQHPSDDAVKDFLTRNLPPLPLRVAAIDVTYGPAGQAGGLVTFQAQVETTEPLYRRLDSADYLHTHAPAEIAAIDAASTLLHGPDGARLVATAGKAPDDFSTLGDPPSPATASPAASLILLKPQTPPGTSALAVGKAIAWRRDGVWVLTGEVHVDPTRYVGEPKPPGPAAFDLDLPADAARLKKLLTDDAAYAAKVRAAGSALAAEMDRQRQQRSDAFAQLLRPGTLFSGVVMDAARSDSHAVTIEIVESAQATHRVAAALRNDGGWAESRPFQGEWTVDPRDDVCTLTLRTRNDERVDDAGPLIEDRGGLSISLQVQPDGTATDAREGWRLRRLDAAGTAALKAELTRPVAQALAATKPGTLYRGTATAKQRRTTEALLLRFTEQTGDGVLLRASLESATVPGWRRAFRGTVIANTYRGTWPIRLRSDDADRATQADPKSPLGINTTNDSLAISLRVDGTRLIGEDDRFAYQFEPAPDGDQETADRRQGTGDTRQGPTQAAQSAGSAVVTGSDQATRLQTPNTKLQTPAAAAVAAYPTTTGAYVYTTADDAPSGSPPSGTAKEGRWLPLPRNNGHPVQTIAQALNAKLNSLRIWEDRLAGWSTTEDSPDDDRTTRPASGKPTTLAAAYLVFDGHDPVPTVAAKELVIVYVGPLEPLSAATLARNPELRTYPAIELAPAKPLTDGNRYAPLALIAPGYLGFGQARVAATIEHPSDGITVLRYSAPPAANRPSAGSPKERRYALMCGDQAYEVTVK